MTIRVERDVPNPPPVRRVILELNPAEARALMMDLSMHPSISAESRLIWTMMAKEVYP